MSVHTNDQAARVLESIVAERADQDASRTFTPRSDKRPSGKQVYYFAHLLADIAGIPWPETSAQASDLIAQLKDQAAAVKATQAGDVAPPEFDAGF
jgi:hypothetical protein